MSGMADDHNTSGTPAGNTAFMRAALADWREGHLFRDPRVLASSPGPVVVIDGRNLLQFCSNDYLGLASHPALALAAAEAAVQYGSGAAASRLVSGTTSLHRELEAAVADWLKSESAVVFSSGYHANLAMVRALAGKKDVIFSDAFNHASLIDGCKLSGARVRVYSHVDMEELDRLLAEESPARRRVILTESLFSMDGDEAPLGEIVALAEKHRALTAVDEAHAMGVFGRAGRGLAAEQGLDHRLDARMGTFGKALGAAGAFIVGRRELGEYLVNQARSFLYTTAPPPPTMASALAGLEIAAGPEGDGLRARLKKNTDSLRQNLAMMGYCIADGRGPIIPVIIGSDGRTMAMAEALYQRGVFVQGIRPPSVAPGTSRLRVTLSAAHGEAHLLAAREVFQALNPAGQ